jgi:hypothetical protein
MTIDGCGSIPAKELVARAAQEIKKRAEALEAQLAEIA